MYKTEPHLHTAEISSCANIRASEMVRLHYEAGFNTIFITDHLSWSFCDSLGDIPWQEKTAIFLSGYYKAKVAAEKYDITVLMAAEVTFRHKPNDYLVYGITKEFLDAYPDLCEMGINEFYKIAQKHNIFVVQAHPNRDGHCFPTPQSVDGFEVYNPNPRHDDASEKTEQCANEYGLFKTAGSDSHRTEDIGRTGILTSSKINSAEDYINHIKNGSFEIFREC